MEKITINYIFQRFRKMKKDYTGNTSVLVSVFYFIDWLLAWVLYGASISDYFAFGFYKMRPNGRNEYITYRRYHKLMRIANNQKDKDICRSKLQFNQYFSEFLGREWLDVSVCSQADFRAFASKHSCIFVKEILGFRGNSVKKYQTNETDVDALYLQLRADKNGHYIVEEAIREDASLRDFHPWSVNSIRIVTMFNTTTDKVIFMNARLRVGNNRNSVDNTHYDGIASDINVETGIVEAKGYDTYNHLYLKHPITGKMMLGFQIPKWDECLAFVERAARKLPTVRYVGWDVVLKDDGEFCLIEANDNADHDSQQMHKRGLWKDYKQILKQLK